MPSPPPDFHEDLQAVAAIPAVTTILEVVCRTTGMRFAAVARVTEARWICCAVRDEMAFGLVPGGELKVETTLCNEIRASGEPVVIEHVEQDAQFRHHATPALYGFQSYISVPIVRQDGSFFGTLCAIDPQPCALNNPAVIGMFRLFGELIAFHLDAHHKLALAEREHARRQERFRGGLGHDLRNTLAAIEAGTRLLRKTPLNARASMIVTEMQASAGRLAAQVAEAMQQAE